MSFESSPEFKSAALTSMNEINNNARYKCVRSDEASANANNDLTTKRLLDEEPPKHLQWITGDYESLPEVPMLFPIEQTSVMLTCNNPTDIANRIVSCLQKLSIAAEFDSTNASLFAETLDHTRFYVRLYRNSNETDSIILVELQKADGDSVDYMACVRAILAAAQGDNSDGERPLRRRCSCLTLPPSLVHGKKHIADTFQNVDYAVASSVQCAEDLLLKDRMDAVQLGLDSLMLLTDSEKSHASKSAANAVLYGDSAGHATIKNFIIDQVNRRPSSDDHDREDRNSDFAMRQEAIMHNMALAVLGNALQTALDHDRSSLEAIVISEEWMGDSGIVNVLLSELSNANHRTHDAYYAARCLAIMLEISPEVKKKLAERGLENVMKASSKVGRSRHSLLANECDEALSLLEERR